jgi:hypothetical protein
MSMSPLVIRLKQALADVGITAGGTQDDVILTATCYIAAISKSEKGEWVAPVPFTTQSPSVHNLGDLLAADEEKALAATRLEIAAEDAAKPKAKAKKKVAK